MTQKSPRSTPRNIQLCNSGRRHYARCTPKPRTTHRQRETTGEATSLASPVPPLLSLSEPSPSRQEIQRRMVGHTPAGDRRRDPNLHIGKTVVEYFVCSICNT